MARPAAAKAVRRAYVEGMCEEATSDLLSWALEKALESGDAQLKHVHGRQQQLLCEHREAEGLPALQVAAWRGSHAHRPIWQSRPSSPPTLETCVFPIPHVFRTTQTPQN